MKISNQKYMLRQLRKEWEELPRFSDAEEYIKGMKPVFEAWLRRSNLLEDE